MTLKQLIQRHEGLRLAPYKCPTGHWTIGWGHNLEAHGEPIPESISLQQAEEYLDADISIKRVGCRIVCPSFDKLNDVRQACLVDMAFNVGTVGLGKFKRMLAWIEKGIYQQAAIEMIDSRWAKQVGNRATELAVMMSTGVWPTL